MNIFQKIKDIPKEFGKGMIKIYQKTLSTDHSFWARPDVYRACIHYPSCSQYTYDAVDKFGLVKGSVMGGFRIMRCNPYTKHRIDPVPDKFSIKANPQEKED